MKKKEMKVTCIAYLSTTGELHGVEARERQQFRYISDYAQAHNIEITKVMHRNVLGQASINKHFDQMVNMIKKGQVDGIITLNMLAISSDEADAYYKVGKVKAAGGVMVTVDEGRLGMYINRGALWEKN